MLQLIESFTSADKKIAGIAEKKIRLHLWYLSEDLAALPLFDDDISDDDKGTIFSALQKEPLPEDLHRLAPNQIPQFQNLSVAQFVTRRSLNLFESLRLPQDFLAAAVNTWTERADYNAAQKTVRALKVANDCAERAVRLASDFNKLLTNSDDHRSSASLPGRRALSDTATGKYNKGAADPDPSPHQMTLQNIYFCDCYA